MNLSEAIETVKETERSLNEFTVETAAIRFEPGIVLAGDVSLRITQAGLSHLCERIGAPAWYMNKLEDHARTDLLQYHINRGDLGLETVNTISRGGEFVAFADPSLLKLRATEVLAAAAEGLNERHEAWSGLNQKLDSIRSLREEPVHVEAMLQRWLGDARLPARKFMPLLMEAWRQEGSDQTAFGVWNGLTRLATHSPDLTPPQRRILARLAGILSFRQVHFCDKCFSVLTDAGS